MRRDPGPGQLSMLYKCTVCHRLVPYHIALARDPHAKPFNTPLHRSCDEFTFRWDLEMWRSRNVAQQRARREARRA
jgi:hypothetical protein